MSDSHTDPAEILNTANDIKPYKYTSSLIIYFWQLGGGLWVLVACRVSSVILIFTGRGKRSFSNSTLYVTKYWRDKILVNLLFIIY